MTMQTSAEVFDTVMALSAQGLTQGKISTRTGVSRLTVGRILRGEAARARTCARCGGPVQPGNATGICHTNPECDAASHHAAYIARTEGVTRINQCSVCGRDIKVNSKYGVCNRKDNPECVKAHNAARYIAHPEHLEQQLRRRSDPVVWCKQQVSYLHGRDLLIDLDAPYLLEQWGDGHCPVCRTEYAVGDATSRAVSPSMDRVYKARGYQKGNVRIICMKCNRRKNDMSGAELMALAQDTLRAEAWADSMLPPTLTAS